MWAMGLFNGVLGAAVVVGICRVVRCGGAAISIIRRFPTGIGGIWGLGGGDWTLGYNSMKF